MTASASMPSQVGRYEIKGVIGQGGMGTVFRAYDPRFERHVAVKVLPFHLLGHEGLRARFEREAKTIASLEHPAIVPVYDFNEHNGQPYLVMRLMPGGTLAERLVGGPLSTAEVARILQRIGSALDEAHAQGIVHRDLKPGNILFDKYDNAYLSDFGIVRLAEGTGVDLTGTGMVGTPGYMSPEQIQGKTIDGRTDIYALGVLVFEMLTARKPYMADTPAMIMMKQITEPVPDIHVLRPDLSADFDEVIESSLSREREKRPASAGELANLLSAAALATTRASESLAAAAKAVESAPESFTPSSAHPTEVESVTPPDAGEAAIIAAYGAAEAAPPVAETVVASPPLDSVAPATPDITPPPAASRSRPVWLPALIVIISIIIIIGAIGTAMLVISQLGSDDTTAGVEPTAEPAGESDPDIDVTNEVDTAGEGDTAGELNIDQTLDEAADLQDNGDYNEVLNLTEAVLEVDPENLFAVELRLYALRDLGRFDEAIATADRLIELGPNISGFYGERAVTIDWSGDTAGAIPDVEKCIEIDPENTDCWFLLGIFHQLLGDLEAAKEAWLQAAAFGSDSADLYRELAWVTLATDDDPQLALEFANQAVELAPDDAANWHALAHMAAAAGNRQLAVEGYRRYLEIVPPGECDDCVAEAEAFLAEQGEEPAGAGEPDPRAEGMMAIFLNMNEPILDDIRVRQALALSVDRGMLAAHARDASFLDAEPSSAWLHPALLNLDFVESGLPFTPDMAQFLLAEAGYPEGEGFPPITLLSDADPRNITVLHMLRDMWQVILGIDVAIEVSEANYFGQIFQDAPPLYRLGYVAGPDDTPDSLLRSFFGTDGEGNFIGYSNPEFDRLLEEAATFDDPQARRILLIEADNIVTSADTVVIPLFYYYEER